MEYSKDYASKCPTDASAVTHTVTYQKASCSRFPEDVVTAFVCSRDSGCVKCAENYRD